MERCYVFGYSLYRGDINRDVLLSGLCRSRVRNCNHPFMRVAVVVALVFAASATALLSVLSALPGRAGGIMGSTMAHSASVRSLGNEGRCGPPQGGVRASTSGAPSRITRPIRNHIRFTRLKNFSDR